MKLIYVAGPFRGASHWDVAQNIRRAEELALGVWAAGAACICPHLNTAHFQGVLPDKVWLEGDIEILRRCDGIILTWDWGTSKGAIEERNIAIAHGLPVFQSVLGLKHWLATGKLPI